MTASGRRLQHSFPDWQDSNRGTTHMDSTMGITNQRLLPGFEEKRRGSPAGSNCEDQRIQRHFPGFVRWGSRNRYGWFSLCK
ncbi:hypothetical protein B9Z55_010957 [Caenorhabditis nigoni]|uniref:Uncharacterized protein n=1 Tax=Caenorhabditis nigoni TaxID=1611254 RepID=A0A2G5UIM2_9PELO|nr:hypothetical protein B9Z55_010957 [Caenorhabditis nigoni]